MALADRFWPWVCDPPRLLWAILISVVAFVAAEFIGTERGFRWLGMALQIVGLFGVAVGVWKTRNDFGEESPSLRWARNHPFRKQRTIERAVAIVTGAASLTARGDVSNVIPEGDLNRRIKALEQGLAELDQRVTRENQAVNAELVAQAGAMREAEQRREEGDRKLHSLLQNTATGGLGLSAASVVVLAVGLVMSTGTVWLFG